MDDDQRIDATELASELMNWFAEHHGEMQPKQIVDGLIMTLAILIRVSFHHDQEQINRAFNSIDRDLRAVTMDLTEVHTAAGHA